jgi:hypothetical protein
LTVRYPQLHRDTFHLLKRGYLGGC